MRNSGNRYRYANEAVGAFVLLALVVLFGALLQTGRLREWFGQDTTLRVILPDAGLFGLSDGSEVEVLGTRAGEVRSIVIEPDQQMYADVRLRQNMVPFVRQNSVAIIRRRFGVAGAAFLDISRGSGEPLDWDYAVINAQSERAPTDSVGELIDEVGSKLLPLLEDTQAAIQAFTRVANMLQKPDGPLQGFLNNLTLITGRVERGEGTLGQLITGDRMANELENLVARTNTVAAELEGLLRELTATTNNFTSLTGELDRSLEGRLEPITESLQTILGDVSQASGDLPDLVRQAGESGQELPLLLLQLQTTLVELEALVRQMRGSWLLGGGGDEPPASTRLPMEASPP